MAFCFYWRRRRRRAWLWAGHVAVISMRLISAKLTLNCCKNGFCFGLAIISLGSSSFHRRKAETKWRTGRAILLLLCLCFSLFFWQVENQLPAFSCCCCCCSAFRQRKTWAMSAVETNLIFYFLAAARQTHTQSSSTTSRKSRRCRQATPAADNTSSSNSRSSAVSFFF